MIDNVCIVGAGRVGSALAARLQERQIRLRVTGRELEIGEADLVLICVVDSAIPDVAAAIRPGPWIAHTSGATTLEALHPHRRRFSLHPLQTFSRARGPEQLDGTYAAVTAETSEARALALELAEVLGVVPFDLADEARTLYHAGAVFASNFLVTIHRAASELFEAAGAPPECLTPLIRGTVSNDFELTGPVSRGDWATVAAHIAAIDTHRPRLRPLYEALVSATAEGGKQ